MNINDYILKNLKTLTVKSTVKSAEKQCELFSITHIPVLENGKLIGSFAKRDIQTIENKEDKIENYSYLVSTFFADEKTTILELLTLFAENDCNIIPLLDKEKIYIGYYDLADVLDVFANSPFLLEDSVTLVVKKSNRGYSMSEISQIVESNNAKLLGMYISFQSTDNVEITLKITSKDINEIIQTFRRYSYSVVTEHKDDAYLEDLKERSKYLQKYLNM